MQRVRAMQLTTKKLYTMDQTIQIIKDLANLTDNVYLLDKITLLEQQIKIALVDAKIEEIKRISKTI